MVVIAVGFLIPDSVAVRKHPLSLSLLSSVSGMFVGVLVESSQLKSAFIESWTRYIEIPHRNCAMGGDVRAIIRRREGETVIDGDQYAYDQFGRKSIHTVAIQEQENAVKKMEALVQNGADLNARELRTGNTLLHLAAKTQNYQLAEWLCKQSSVEKKAVNFNYETAYRIAFKARDIRMMQLLRLNGAAFVNPMTSGLSDDSS